MFPFNDINNTPTHVWYADKPPLLGGIPRKISIPEFMQEYQSKGGKPFEYSEAIWYNPHQANIEQNESEFTKEINAEITTALANPRPDDFAICFIDAEVGFGVFARTDIPAFKIIGVYTGDTIYDKEFCKIIGQDQSYLMTTKNLTINSAKRGGIMRFLQHAPTSFDFIKNYTEPPEYSMQDKHIARERIMRLLTGNIYQRKLTNKAAIADVTNLTLFHEALSNEIGWNNFNATISKKDSVTLSKETKNHIAQLSAKNIRGLGNYLATLHENFSPITYPDFVENEWLNIATKLIATANTFNNYIIIKGTMIPFLFTLRKVNQGEQLVYDYKTTYWAVKRCLPRIFTPQGEQVKKEEYRYRKIALSEYYAKPATEYFAKIGKYTPVQYSPFEQPVSFFEFRDILVANNVIPVTHGALLLENDPSIKKLANAIEAANAKINIKYYDCYPGKEKFKDKKNLVLLFTYNKHFQTMVNYIQHDRLLNRNCKFFSITNEIVFEILSHEIITVCDQLAIILTTPDPYIIPIPPYKFGYKHYTPLTQRDNSYSKYKRLYICDKDFNGLNDVYSFFEPDNPEWD